VPLALGVLHGMSASSDRSRRAVSGSAYVSRTIVPYATIFVRGARKPTLSARDRRKIVGQQKAVQPLLSVLDDVPGNTFQLSVVDREHLFHRSATVAGNFINSISLRRDGHFMKRGFGGTKRVKLDTTGRGFVYEIRNIDRVEKATYGIATAFTAP
jgi:hypothetical protein